MNLCENLSTNRPKLLISVPISPFSGRGKWGISTLRGNPEEREARSQFTSGVLLLATHKNSRLFAAVALTAPVEIPVEKASIYGRSGASTQIRAVRDMADDVDRVNTLTKPRRWADNDTHIGVRDPFQ
jgi:hypothetical protein